MPQTPLKILISGQGVAGSSLALMLARHPSFNPKPLVTLIERSPVPRTTGQAVDIRGPAVEIIQKIGIEDKIKALHTTETGIAWTGANGQAIAQFDATGDSQKQSATSEYEILRGELAALLLEDVDATRAAGGADVKIVYGESIAKLDEQDDGVAVEFSKGKLEAQKFDVVVAADGVSSTTRDMIFGDKESKASLTPLGQYIAFFTIPRLEEDNDLWRWYVAPGGLGIHIRPHRNKTTMGCYLTVTNSTRATIPEIEEVLTKGVDEQKAYMRKRFTGIGFQSERVLDAMDKSDDYYMQKNAVVRAPKYAKGRCALIGDTAYCTMGIGTSLAMQGAYLVSGELAKMSQSGKVDVAAALQRYEDILMPYVKKHNMPPGVPQLANPQTGLGIGVLNTTLKIVSWTGVHKLLQRLEFYDDKLEMPDYGW